MRMQYNFLFLNFYWAFTLNQDTINWDFNVDFLL